MDIVPIDQPRRQLTSNRLTAELILSLSPLCCEHPQLFSVWVLKHLTLFLSIGCPCEII